MSSSGHQQPSSPHHPLLVFANNAGQTHDHRGNGRPTVLRVISHERFDAWKDPRDDALNTIGRAKAQSKVVYLQRIGNEKSRPCTTIAARCIA